MRAFLAAAIGAALIGPAPVVAATQGAAPRSAPASPYSGAKQRLIVLSDIEADPDDSQSFVRLLLYSNEIDIEGLVATTSVWMKTETHPESIRSIINAYGKVQPNLLKHEPGYPTAARLNALVVSGQPVYGVAGVGDGKDTAGSELIVHALESADPRPLWVCIWGGSNTLAQALMNIRSTKGVEEANRLISKLRVYAISDQDDSGSWIRRTFPDLFYVVSPGGYGAATWTAINTIIDGVDNRTISNAWIAENIQQGHGPLGAVYPDVAWGMEGDTPSFLSLIPNGLNVPERPDFGGWGGRYELYRPSPNQSGTREVSGGIPQEPEARPIWTNAIDSFTPLVPGEYNRAVKPGPKSFNDFRVSLWRWRDDFQNDMAARIGWTTLPYEKANHPPVVALTHPDHLTVRSGERFTLDAGDSTDPDGDSLSYFWFNYPEAGTLGFPVPIASADNVYHATIIAPVVKTPQTAHFIVRVTDKGTPPLTRYKRVIVTILPSG